MKNARMEATESSDEYLLMLQIIEAMAEFERTS